MTTLLLLCNVFCDQHIYDWVALIDEVSHSPVFECENTLSVVMCHYVAQQLLLHYKLHGRCLFIVVVTEYDIEKALEEGDELYPCDEAREQSQSQMNMDVLTTVDLPGNLRGNNSASILKRTGSDNRVINIGFQLTRSPDEDKITCNDWNDQHSSSAACDVIGEEKSSQPDSLSQCCQFVG